MLTLFYSPHAASVDNEAGRASGHADVPLSQPGLQQARELGRHYATQALDAIFCSDLQRASRTADIAFSERGLPCVRDARLRECDYGDLTQCPVAQVDEEFPRRILEPFPNGQSVLMAVQGVGTFLQDVLREHDGQTIVVIGHRVTRYGLAYWCGDASLESIVCASWQWREIPIWCYEVHARDIERRFASTFEQTSHAEMSGDSVVQLMQLFDQHSMEVVVDGGWGVDALLGEQTRSHQDLDIAIQHKDVPQLRALLEARGYKDIPRNDSWECNFVVGDEKGHAVDVHSYTYDAHGTLVFGVEYPFGSLTGTGSIQGYSVKCISPEWMVKFHSGYALDENDYRDVSALCERFGMALPAEYERFTREGTG